MTDFPLPLSVPSALVSEHIANEEMGMTGAWTTPRLDVVRRTPQGREHRRHHLVWSLTARVSHCDDIDTASVSARSTFGRIAGATCSPHDMLVLSFTLSA